MDFITTGSDYLALTSMNSLRRCRWLLILVVGCCGNFVVAETTELLGNQKRIKCFGETHTVAILRIPIPIFTFVNRFRLT